MLDWSQCAAVERVPVEALFANLEDGVTVDEFLAWFHGPTRERVLAVLRFAEASPRLEPDPVDRLGILRGHRIPKGTEQRRDALLPS